jgi:hypothetical protein
LYEGLKGVKRLYCNVYTTLELSVAELYSPSIDVKRGVSTIAVFTRCKVIERRSGCIMGLFAIILI